MISFTFYLTEYQLNNLSIWAISPQQLQPGDLVFFRIKHALHVGFYGTVHHFIHASVSQGVTRSSMDTPYWQKYFITAPGPGQTR
ncbi:C40 family peptidase [Salmonella enterica]|nr:C40 family peptidase [Salmonella enterica]MDJ7049551.1 C40 family peptidase [Salmonella enterica]MDJ7338907.1 C40 family peptidase [Salmonella enterica]